MSHINSFNTNSYNVWNSYNISDERSRILTWLSLLEPRIRHQDIQNRPSQRCGGMALTKIRNLGAGALVVEDVNAMTQFCFAMGIQGSARLLLGKSEP